MIQKLLKRGNAISYLLHTSGIGILDPEHFHISTGKRIKPGDKLIISGPLGNHAIAVLGARNNLSFSTPVTSDCASLNHLINRVLQKSNEVRFMRDMTRGGLATVLNELATMIGFGYSC